MMRNWLLAFVAAVFPGLEAQDHPAPPVPIPTTAASAHRICGGDEAAPRQAQLLSGYGGGGFPVTTAIPRAQAFFDNGMQLGHAFAHSASIAAFHQATLLDPDCAMCQWGEAWASGPTINYDKTPAEIAPLAAMTARAATFAAAHGTDRERALIAALALRYRDGGGKPQNMAFARAMDALARAYPQDDEIAVLAADAWLIAPWKTDDLTLPRRSIALLERVLARRPDYTPAIHFYIHATEMVHEPGRAERYADRLPALAPAASHLVHMPSHTYYWVGRYQDAVDANVRAVAIGIANARRLGLPQPDGVWSLPYHAHNVVYGVGGALMSGDAKDALALSTPMVERAAKAKAAPAFMQMMAGLGYAAEARFADPQVVLALPQPHLPYLTGLWHYARGEAQARLGHADAVRAEAARIPWSMGKVSEDDGSAPALRELRIARLVLTGRAAMLDNRPGEALKAFRKAAGYQENKTFAAYADPPAWWYPVRRSVAEALLAQGKPRDALDQIAATLRQRPDDPVTLALKARAETAIGARSAAQADRGAALAGWRGARWVFDPALT